MKRIVLMLTAALLMGLFASQAFADHGRRGCPPKRGHHASHRVGHPYHAYRYGSGLHRHSTYYRNVYNSSLYGRYRSPSVYGYRQHAYRNHAYRNHAYRPVTPRYCPPRRQSGFSLYFGF